MCVGIPMQVIESDEFYALCEGRGERRRLNVMLLGRQLPGTWVLAFLDSARSVIGSTEAARINDALDALEAVMNGETNVDRFFSDLVRKE
jgi:hydrogenase expression/formation protein HypC